MKARGERWGLAACLGLLALGAMACTLRDGVLGSVTKADGGRDHAGPATGCQGSPLVTLHGHQTCTGRWAANTFAQALCTCGDLQVAASLTTRAFDSRNGPYAGDGYGAAVGVNGNYSSRFNTDVGGSFSVAGGGDLQFVGNLRVYGDLYVAGNIAATGATTVSRNAWLGGNYSGLGALTVVGDLHHAGTVPTLGVTAKSNQKQTVTVAKPCPCQSSDILDIAALVNAAKLKNDNASLGLSADAFVNLSGSTRLVLPCGQAYLSQIGGIGDLVIQVTGMAALFVDGSINLLGNLSVEIAPGAEIDVFVKQDLAVSGSLALASKDRPAAGRIWVGGTAPITLPTPWIGNLYAPSAQVSALFALEVWGSIFAQGFSGGASGSFTFDRAIMAPASCAAPSPPAGVCTSCTWCSGGQACLADTCSACRDDGDCCGLSTCSNGSCGPLVEAVE